MDKWEGTSTNQEPHLDGSNYAFWSIRMEGFLHSLGIDISLVVVNGYKFPDAPPIDAADKKWYECNAKSKNEILSDLADS